MATEMKSEPEVSAAPEAADDLDPQALAAIRDLLKTEASTPPAREVAPLREKAAPKTEAPSPRDTIPSRPEAALPPLSPVDDPALMSKSRKRADGQGDASPGFIARIKSRITGYRPTPKHMVLAGLALVVLVRPWLVVGLTLLALFVVIGIFLALGYDGFWKRAMAIGHWYARRHPSRADELHRKLDDFAVKWDAFLDRFPEGTVDGLYLPDFGELATADARHDAAMERRLSSMQENEA